MSHENFKSNSDANSLDATSSVPKERPIGLYAAVMGSGPNEIVPLTQTELVDGEAVPLISCQ